MIIEKCTVSNNIAGDMGGGIYAHGNFIAENITVSGNLARIAGGLCLYNTDYDINHSTIAYNGAQERSGGVFVPLSSIVFLYNSIIAQNKVASELLNCDGGNQIVSMGNNLCDDQTCLLTHPNDMIDDPFLNSLQDNGGPTKTHAIPFYSPAVDAANSEYCPAQDQRGDTRPYGSGCDIGAFEWSIFIEPAI